MLSLRSTLTRAIPARDSILFAFLGFVFAGARGAV